MDYMTVKDAHKKWGYTEAIIRTWCREGVIKVTVGAEKKNGRWQIPSIAECPKTIKR